MGEIIKLYNEEEIAKKVKYVAGQASKLSISIVGVDFPIHSLTIFSHEEKEFENLKNILFEIGQPFNENNGPRVVLNNPISAGKNTITHLRIRKPDTERPQVGCNDFDTDYYSFKEKYLLKYTNNLKLTQRPDYEMIEFYNPKFDVLAYVVSE